MPTRIRTLIAATLLAFNFPASPAHAEDGVWKVGDGYVIRFETLDLSRAMDRQMLLAQVERTANKLCEGQKPATARAACKTETIRSMKDSVRPGLRAALDVARFERDGVQQAQR
jgi:UrcA family protein